MGHGDPEPAQAEGQQQPTQVRGPAGQRGPEQPQHADQHPGSDQRGQTRPLDLTDLDGGVEGPPHLEDRPGQPEQADGEEEPQPEHAERDPIQHRPPPAPQREGPGDQDRGQCRPETDQRRRQAGVLDDPGAGLPGRRGADDPRADEPAERPGQDGDQGGDHKDVPHHLGQDDHRGGEQPASTVAKVVAPVPEQGKEVGSVPRPGPAGRSDHLRGDDGGAIAGWMPVGVADDRPVDDRLGPGPDRGPPRRRGIAAARHAGQEVGLTQDPRWAAGTGTPDRGLLQSGERPQAEGGRPDTAARQADPEGGRYGVGGPALDGGCLLDGVAAPQRPPDDRGGPDEPGDQDRDRGRDEHDDQRPLDPGQGEHEGDVGQLDRRPVTAGRPVPKADEGHGVLGHLGREGADGDAAEHLPADPAEARLGVPRGVPPDDEQKAEAGGVHGGEDVVAHEERTHRRQVAVGRSAPALGEAGRGAGELAVEPDRTARPALEQQPGHQPDDGDGGGDRPPARPHPSRRRRPVRRPRADRLRPTRRRRWTRGSAAPGSQLRRPARTNLDVLWNRWRAGV